MCAVIGYYAEKPKRSHKGDIEAIWRESLIRGVHAMGAATLGAKGAASVKSVGGGYESHLKSVFRSWPFQRMIGHCRYSTSGDWNDCSNNQPIEIGTAAVVMNGVVSMMTKEENAARFMMDLSTDNDAEIPLRLFVNGGKSFDHFISKGSFSFAGIFMEGDRMIAIRNANRPLWFAKKDGATFIASTLDIFQRAGFANAKALPAGAAFNVEDL